MQSNNIKRPQSPHLTIYTPQLTSVLSIVHRGTGIILVGAIVGVVLWDSISYLFGMSFTTFVLSCYLAKMVIFIQLIVLASVIYHCLNGLRHLMWDMGIGLELSSVYRSGGIVVILTLILTGIAAITIANASYPLFVGL